MTIRYVGLGGNDGNSGETWALRKLTLNGAEDTPIVVGDVVYVGPGVYRETHTIDVSGGNTYVVGTVSVTNGDETVTGSGTAFEANVGADYQFHIRLFASGSDGVTNGDDSFSSAAGNFQASMIGRDIQINTKGAYRISAVADTDNITLTDPNGLGWPANGGGGLDYSVMSGEGNYTIDSITDDTHLELARPWNGPTLTGVAYITYQPITYIADVTGEHTDGVGGVVRITGSDNDQTITRGSCIYSDGKSYRIFRGFRYDMATGLIDLTNAPFFTFEDFIISSNDNQGISCVGSSQLALTVRRFVAVTAGYTDSVIYLREAATLDDTGHLIENGLFLASNLYSPGVGSARDGGITVRNCTFFGSYYGIDQITAFATGQTLSIRHCVFWCCRTALEATATGFITEDYNTFFRNNSDRVNTATGANSLAYPPLLNFPLLHAGDNLISGYKLPWLFGELSEWSQVAGVAGIGEAGDDFFGIARPATSAKKSWGAFQFADAERDTGTTYNSSAAALELLDAARVQLGPFEVPNASIDIHVKVNREADYAGTNPQLIIKQPGASDDITTDAAAASQWNELKTTLTPNADPSYVYVELVSNNTAAAGSYATYFDQLVVNGKVIDFDEWITDRIILKDHEAYVRWPRERSHGA